MDDDIRRLLEDDALRGRLLTFLRTSVVLFLLVVLTFYVARSVKRRVERVPYLRDRDPAITELGSNIAYLVVLVLGIISSLAAVEIPVTTVVTALGVSTLAVSLALQDVLRNFVAGIYLLLEKPYRIGDTITLRDFTGEVTDVELRTTMLRTTTGAQVIVPNQVLMTDIVTNRSTDGLQAYSITVSGGPEVLEGGLERYAELLEGKEYVSGQPEHEVYVEALEAEVVSVRLKCWTRPRSTGIGELVAELRRLAPDATVTAKAEA